MSTLTKLFVALLVIVSLLQTAGLVVYVSNNDTAQKNLDTAKQQVTSLTAENQRLTSDLTAAKAAADKNYELMTQQIELKRQGDNENKQKLAERDAQKSELNARLTLAQADVARLTEALKASEDTKSKLQEQMVALRSSNDQNLTNSAQMSQSISDLTNKLDVTERERRWLAEQLEEARNQTTKLSAALKDAGIEPSRVLASTSGVKAGAPAINGVIREIRKIGPLDYATISVGSSDNVTKGMEFNVVDRATGAFYGKLTVDTVDPTEAVGRLTGNRVPEVRAGMEVRTQ